MSGRSITLLVASLVCFVVSGCGPSGFPVAPVTGKVLCKGQPVSSGTITFVPIGKPGSKETGKPASGMLKPDGTFSLSTYGRFDGAIVGEHDVQFTSSEGEESEAEAPEADEASPSSQRPAKKVANTCKQTTKITLEVKAGTKNEFTIEVK